MTTTETRPMSVEEFEEIGERVQRFIDDQAFGWTDTNSAEIIAGQDAPRLMEAVAHLQTVVADLTDQIRGVDTRSPYRYRQHEEDEG